MALPGKLVERGAQALRQAHDREAADLQAGRQDGKRLAQAQLAAPFRLGRLCRCLVVLGGVTPAACRLAAAAACTHSAGAANNLLRAAGTCSIAAAGDAVVAASTGAAAATAAAAAGLREGDAQHSRCAAADLSTNAGTHSGGVDAAAAAAAVPAATACTANAPHELCRGLLHAGRCRARTRAARARRQVCLVVWRPLMRCDVVVHKHSHRRHGQHHHDGGLHLTDKRAAAAPARRCGDFEHNARERRGQVGSDAKQRVQQRRIRLPRRQRSKGGHQ